MSEDNKKPGDNNSGWDEAVQMELQDAIGSLVDVLGNNQTVDLAIRSLSPGVVKASKWLPHLVGYGTGKLANNLFKSPILQSLFKDTVMHGSRRVRALIQQKGGVVENVGSKEYGAAVREGVKEALEKKYVVIDGLLHSMTCARMQHRIKQPQGKDQQQASGNVEVTLLEAEQQHIVCSACCFDGVQAEIKTKTEAPAKVEVVKPPRSPMEVINRANPDDRVIFLKWLHDLPVNERKRVDEFLKHLDSEEEFSALISCVKEQPEIVYDMLTLLENSNGSHRTKQCLLLAGQAIEQRSTEALAAIKSAMKHVGKKAVEFDASFAPVAKRLRENDASERPDNTIMVALGRKKPENKGFLNATGRFVKSLFLFF